MLARFFSYAGGGAGITYSRSLDGSKQDKAGNISSNFMFHSKYDNENGNHDYFDDDLIDRRSLSIERLDWVQTFPWWGAKHHLLQSGSILI